jgi:hypothetical protein
MSSAHSWPDIPRAFSKHLVTVSKVSNVVRVCSRLLLTKLISRRYMLKRQTTNACTLLQECFCQHDIHKIFVKQSVKQFPKVLFRRFLIPQSVNWAFNSLLMWPKSRSAIAAHLTRKTDSLVWSESKLRNYQVQISVYIYFLAMYPIHMLFIAL